MHSSASLPWLIFKRDYHVPVSVIERETFNRLEKWQGNHDVPYIIYRTEKHNDLFLFRLEKFLDWLQPGTVSYIYKRDIK